MSVVAALLTALALLAAPRSRAGPERLRRLTADPSRTAATSYPRPMSGRLAAGILGAGVATVVGGVAGLVAGVLAAGLADRWLRRAEPASVRRRRQRLAADLPASADLLTACLAAGGNLVDAVDAVAAAIDGPLGAVLGETASTVRLGGDPVSSWRRLGHDPVLEPLGRALARAAEGGSPPAGIVARLADESRRVRRLEAQAAARSVSVKVAAPLGLCFLPAFALVGVVPVVAGLATAPLG